MEKLFQKLLLRTRTESR